MNFIFGICVNTNFHTGKTQELNIGRLYFGFLKYLFFFTQVTNDWVQVFCCIIELKNCIENSLSICTSNFINSLFKALIGTTANGLRSLSQMFDLILFCHFIRNLMPFYDLQGKKGKKAFKPVVTVLMQQCKGTFLLFWTGLDEHKDHSKRNNEKLTSPNPLS